VPLGFHPNVRVSLHHAARNVPGECHDRGVRGLGFCKARDERVPQVVKAT
jgi:hypothetical protein